MPGKKFDLSVILELIDKLSAPMARIGTKMRNFSKITGMVGKKMSGVGRSMTMGLTLPIVGLGIASTKSAFSLSENMANVATLLNDNLGDVNKRTLQMEKGVQRMAIRLGKDTGDISEGLYQVVSAFGDAENNMERLDVVARAGVAGRAATVESLNLLSAVTKGYGDTSVEAMKKASDLAFQTVKLGQTTFPELASSMGRTIPLAAKLGVQQEELFGAFSALTGVTGNTAEVSTQLAGILRAIIKPTDLMRKAIKHLGFESGEQMVRQEGLVGSLRMLNELVGGNTEAWGKLTPRAEALTAIFALNGEVADDFNKKLEQMKTASGSTDEAFRRQTKGVAKAAFTWKQFIAKLQVAGQQLGKVFGPILMKIVDRIMVFVNWFGKLDESTKKMIVKIALFAAALGPLLLIAGKVVSAISAISMALSFLALNPAILAIGALVAAVGVIVFLLYRWEKRTGGLSRLMKRLSANMKYFLAVLKSVAAPFMPLIQGLEIAWELVKKIEERGGFKKIAGGMKAVGGGGRGAAFGKALTKAAVGALPVVGPMAAAAQALVTVKVAAEKGTTAVIGGTEKKGTGMKLKVQSESYLGRTIEETP